MDNSGITNILSVSEALELLEIALKKHGLDSANITISSHGLTPEQSGSIARDIVAGGFGEDVRLAGKLVKYEDREGWFSWNTVGRDGDYINLFFSVGEDDQPVNYFPSEKEVS
ncbi:hypothetical protein L7E55_07455 [Pelotomaculum isophthalicicum JI]|uniref:Uncharacterized protein n=1 Tax=Pelotomaculum isophthalicicum JI TaxID=947010 RepID=A0A9X4GYW9_9FIRM|nr:hypothetical protein [Pelotomaculum isophthalicicum]MDF9408195.1 hypothetical protein [Pelotomaculum isophthalicicum JI]